MLLEHFLPWLSPPERVSILKPKSNSIVMVLQVILDIVSHEAPQEVLLMIERDLSQSYGSDITTLGVRAIEEP